MSADKNELRDYIESGLCNNFEKITSSEASSHNQVIFYKHNESNKMLVERISSNRNDDVFRILKNKRIENLPKIYDVCSDEDELIVLEEFIEGISLSELMAQRNLKTSEACKYCCDICHALTDLHKLGIVHRDIKPANVIIKNDNSATLIDLGIAHLITPSGEKDANILGTVGYAAPEQYGLTQSGAAVDIYSLGVMLNMMLTGVHPAIKVPKGPIKYVINKAVSTQISKRYRTAAQFEKHLKLFC